MNQKLLPLLALLLASTQLSAQPVITNQPANQAVVWGGNATFSVMVTGVGPFTYQWQLNGTNLPNNIITTVAGGNLFNNQPATNTILNSASGMAMDTNGNLFIADTGNNIIRKVGTNGIATIVAGNGSGSFSGDGGAATNAGLFAPSAVIVDSAGNLLVADSGNNRIRKVGTNGIISTVAGNGFGGYGGNNGAATTAQINNPSGLCLDATGNLFIADTFNFVIRKVGINGIITTVAGINGRGPGFSGDGFSATAAGLNYPTGVAVDSSNNLYIADSQNNRIRKVNASGTISTFAGNGTANYSGDGGAATSSTLNLPVGVVVDAARNLFIVDSGNQCVRKVGTNNIITTIAGNGTNNYSGDGGAATNANLSNPQGMALDNIGDLFIADSGNNRIRQVGTNGIITTVAGRILNDGDFATNATLNEAAGIALDSIGNFYIADTINNRIRKVDTNGVISTVAGNGNPGFSGDGGAATNANLKFPFGIAVDAWGSLFIADTYNQRIRKVDTNGIISTAAGMGFASHFTVPRAATNASIGRPFNVAVDAMGNVFIPDFDLDEGFKVGTNGMITVVSSFVNNPFAVAVDYSGDVFITDSFFSSVDEINTNGVSSQVAGHGIGGFAGDGGPATGAMLNSPRGLVVDAAGNLFISDNSNSRIRKVNTNGIITTIAGNGTFGYAGDGGPAGNASLDFPFGIALDAVGNVYFADPGNNRIRKLAYVDYADQPAFTVTNVTLASLSNNYSVIITSASGSVTSSVAMVSLQLPPITPVFTASNGIYNFTWSAVSNLTYELQCTTNLAAPVWVDLGSPVTATNNSVSTTDAVDADGQRFYRVRLWP
jgi:trimeric autotransporter adhesin